LEASGEESYGAFDNQKESHSKTNLKFKLIEKDLQKKNIGKKGVPYLRNLRNSELFGSKLRNLLAK